MYIDRILRYFDLFRYNRLIMIMARMQKDYEQGNFNNYNDKQIHEAIKLHDRYVREE